MLYDLFSSNPYFTAANLTAIVNTIPWQSNQLDLLIPRNYIPSPTSHIQLQYEQGKTGLVPAKPTGDMNGQEVRGTKAKIFHLDVSGYPQISHLKASEVKNRLQPGTTEFVGLQTLVQGRQAEMARRDENVTEYLMQGALENVIQAIDDNGNPYVLEDLTGLPGGAPTVFYSDWLDDTNDFADDVAEAKLQLQQNLGLGFGQVNNWILLTVGPAGSGVRRNKSVRTGKFIAEPGFALQDKVSKSWMLDDNVVVINYNGYAVGGLSALDGDVRTVNGQTAAYGTCYLIPIVAGLFDQVAVPPEIFGALNEPGLPRYSWIMEDVLNPETSVILKYWAGKVIYNKRASAVGKFKRNANGPNAA